MLGCHVENAFRKRQSFVYDLQRSFRKRRMRLQCGQLFPEAALCKGFFAKANLFRKRQICFCHMGNAFKKWRRIVCKMKKSSWTGERFWIVGDFIREVAQPYVPNGNFFPKAAGACLPYGEETLEAAQVLHMGNLARKLQGLVCQKAKASRKRQKLACHKEKTSRPQHTLVCHMLSLVRKCQRLICQKTSGSRKRRKLVCNMVNSCRKRRRHACYPEAAKACLPLPPTGCLPQWQPSVCRFRHEFAIWQSSRVAPGMRSLYGWPLPGCVPHVAKRFRRF